MTQSLWVLGRLESGMRQGCELGSEAEGSESQVQGTGFTLRERQP